MYDMRDSMLLNYQTEAAFKNGKRMCRNQQAHPFVISYRDGCLFCLSSFYYAEANERAL
jgi:hypothetical protein